MLNDVELIKFKQPNDENVKVWRYMNYEKFESLLNEESLYLARSDQFTDTYEGRYPKFHYKDRVSTEEKNNLGCIDYLDLIERSRKKTYINCWHVNDVESAGMWDLYTQTKDDNVDGIAIETTYKKLKDSLPPLTLIGLIEYLDYEKDTINEMNYFASFLHKRKNFEHEKELRIISQLDFSNQEDEKSGIFLPIKINVLINKIHIHPKATQKYSQKIKDVIHRFGFSFEIINSKLYEKPSYI